MCCEVLQEVSFVERFRGNPYRVRVISSKDRVDVFLPVHETFVDLVASFGSGMDRQEIQSAAEDEYQKCLRDGIRRIRGEIG
ncbi:hypothetical protein [Pelobacter propionicus]|uniref:hypothetical protein n=1 Tax=Pelobacter propionicus TaxID=29543 RepID=UPI000057AA67|nr:hypothetical protein [Pelobacter propionicus]